MDDGILQPVLGRAGKFAALDEQIVAPVKGCIPAERADRPGDGSRVFQEFDPALRRMLDKGILPAAQVRIDRPAAAHAPDEMDAVLPRVGQIDFFEHILILPDHQGRCGPPEKKNRVREFLFQREIIFEAKVVIHIFGPRLNIDHGRPPALPRLCRNCAPGALKPHGGSLSGEPVPCNGRIHRASHNGPEDNAAAKAAGTGRS